MASILNVDQINNAAGTSAVTIDSSGNVNIPGHVVQVVREFVSDSSIISVSSTSLTASGIIASITPLKNNSVILVDFSSSMADGVSTALSAQMYYKIGSGSYGSFESGSFYQMGYNAGPSTNRYSPIVFSGKTTATSTSTLSFQPYISSVSGGVARLVHNDASYALTLMEIAQ